LTKVLAVLEAGDRYPSGVVRGTIYRDFFKRDGFDVEFISRQPLETMDFLQDPPRLLRPVVWRQRIRKRILARAERRREGEIVRKSRTADVVYLSKVLTLPLYRKVRDATKARIVLDFGDSVWLYEDRRREAEFQDVLRIVDAVTTDNEGTAEYVRRFNQSCTVIPDSPQLEEFDRRRATRPPRPRPEVVLGWIGTPSTLYNLYEIWEALEIIGQRHPNVTLRLVGAGYDPNLRPAFDNIRYSIVPSYNQNVMIGEIFGMDIGLFPLQNVERSLVRGVLKAAIYMCGEAAVIASPVGQTDDVIRDGENGLLAGTSEEWIAKIDRLISDAALRKQLADAGLETVRRRFRTEQSWELLRAVLRGD
jgi:glycosyltransferase involved in cell wall biosynthesis